MEPGEKKKKEEKKINLREEDLGTEMGCCS